MCPGVDTTNQRQISERHTVLPAVHRDQIVHLLTFEAANVVALAADQRRDRQNEARKPERQTARLGVRVNCGENGLTYFG